MNDDIVKNFLDKISILKQKIIVMYLFGSRSRDDWKPDSDYDILIVLETKDRKILISTSKLISLKIFTNDEFNRLKSIPTPFIRNVLKEGIKIGQNDQRIN